MPVRLPSGLRYLHSAGPVPGSPEATSQEATEDKQGTLRCRPRIGERLRGQLSVQVEPVPAPEVLRPEGKPLPFGQRVLLGYMSVGPRPGTSRQPIRKSAVRLG